MTCLAITIADEGLGHDKLGSGVQRSMPQQRRRKTKSLRNIISANCYSLGRNFSRCKGAVLFVRNINFITNLAVVEKECVISINLQLHYGRIISGDDRYGSFAAFTLWIL